MILGPNGQPSEPMVQVLIEFKPASGDIVVRADTPMQPLAMVGLLQDAVKAVVVAALRAQERPVIVIPNVVPPSDLG